MWLLFLAPGFCYLRLWCNMLDGMVALASGRASLRGEILNDLPDRISDVIIFAGVAHSGLMNPFLGYWAAIFALLTAYVGLIGQAVGVRREFGGVMSKPWRMVMLHLGAWLTFACAGGIGRAAARLRSPCSIGPACSSSRVVCKPSPSVFVARMTALATKCVR